VSRQVKFKRLYDESEREIAMFSKSECAIHYIELEIYHSPLSIERK
jgi:hypothetical protein